MEHTPEEREVLKVLANVYTAYTLAQEAETGKDLRDIAEHTAGEYLRGQDLDNVNWDAMLHRIQNP